MFLDASKARPYVLAEEKQEIGDTHKKLAL